MKYDDASWHYGGDFPDDLPNEAGATHIGMFVAWALLKGLSGSLHINDFPGDIPTLKSRTMTPGTFFLERCDGKFTDEDLNDIGNSFASAYYDKGTFLQDYEHAVGAGAASLYHVPDSWDTFDRLQSVFDTRFLEWQGNA